MSYVVRGTYNLVFKLGFEINILKIIKFIMTKIIGRCHANH